MKLPSFLAICKLGTINKENDNNVFIDKEEHVLCDKIQLIDLLTNLDETKYVLLDISFVFFNQTFNKYYTK